MKVIKLQNEQEVIEFAKRAAAKFAASYDTLQTYTDDEIQEGCLLAIRWNPVMVVVIKVDDRFEPLMIEGAYPETILDVERPETL